MNLRDAVESVPVKPKIHAALHAREVRVAICCADFLVVLDKHNIAQTHKLAVGYQRGEIGAYLVDAMLSVVVSHGGLEDPESGVAVASGHGVARLAEDIAQQLDKFCAGARRDVFWSVCRGGSSSGEEGPGAWQEERILSAKKRRQRRLVCRRREGRLRGGMSRDTSSLILIMEQASGGSGGRGRRAGKAGHWTSLRRRHLLKSLTRTTEAPHHPIGNIAQCPRL